MKRMYIVYISICALPFIGVLIIFILIIKKHLERPDLLSCTSFERALINTVPLYVGKQEFNKGVSDICLCFKSNNLTNNPRRFVTKNSLDICARDKIYKWIAIDKDSLSVRMTDSKLKCLKDGVYEQIIVPKILKELEITYAPGFFKNDLFKYGDDKSHLISSIYINCDK
ncbi:hypothetical protein ACG2K1_11895 [Neisseria sp. 23W00296]|uniref:hypothetical protein n=1 Tax=unclassified Neisseria TaxID=2623750 RepID=UPI0002A1CB6D|nr:MULTISPECIES: hypothetical protein [unclassified Neisseria]EKY09573.1 hypothetical protein HMPREF9120_00398 [Neisseria sp. oral taxon 020 str. F0370]